MFEFEKIDGIVTLAKYIGDEEKVIVPETYEGEPVIAIGNRVFEKAIMTSIVLPDTIEVFGNSAFIACRNLVDINMPANLKIVKHNVFLGCESIVEITFPIGVEKIGPSCFCGCYALTRVFAENENAVLGKDALNGTGKIEEVSFHLIKTLDFHNQSEFVLKFIENWSNIEQYKKDVILSLLKKKVLQYYLFSSGKAHVIYFLFDNKFKPNIEDTDKCLEYYIKVGDTENTAILLDYKNKSFTKEKVVAIKERKDLIEIGLEAMTYSEFRKVWVCSKKDGKITVSGYKGCKIEETIPFEVEGIPITFLACNSQNDYRPIEILNIEADIESIGVNCFSWSKLTKINLPDTLVSIGNGGFSQCVSLTEIILPKNLTSIGTAGFHCCDFESIVIPEGVKEVAKETFRFCHNLKDVILPETIEFIGIRAFNGCTKLEEIIIPSSVKEIANEAFFECRVLKKVTFLGDMPKLGKNVFKYTLVQKQFS